ncbi:MAG: DUF881 domain-containing protein [Mycobacterium leprae]
MQRTKWALAFVMMVFGLLLMTQLRVQQRLPNNSVDVQRVDDLTKELKATQERLKAAEAERDRLSTQLQKAAPGSSAPAVDTTPTQILAGTVATQGPGLIVSVTEDPTFPKARVTDQDLWLVVNELLAAGAEGIAVNDQRLTALSGIRNVGTRIIIYGTMTTSPYQIYAIGDSNVMETALKMRGGIVDQTSKWGVKVTTQRSANILLPAFGAPPVYRFAKAAH